jgi:hypothetical protein
LYQSDEDVTKPPVANVKKKMGLGFWAQVAVMMHAVTALDFSQRTHNPKLLSRRVFAAGISTGLLFRVTSKSTVFAAGATLDDAKKAVGEAQEALEPLNDLLMKENWDAVRTVLKVKLGKLWALGASVNPIVQFAKEAEEPELVELAEELSTALQLADQFTCEYLMRSCGSFLISSSIDS